MIENQRYTKASCRREGARGFCIALNVNQLYADGFRGWILQHSSR